MRRFTTSNERMKSESRDSPISSASRSSNRYDRTPVTPNSFARWRSRRISQGLPPGARYPFGSALLVLKQRAPQLAGIEIHTGPGVSQQAFSP